LALVAAALAVASPDLFFASFVLADPLAYPLVLTTLYVAVCALSRPSRGTQIAFVVLAALTALTRIQYALLPIVFVAGAIVVERGSLRRAVRSFRLTWGIFLAPLAALVVLGLLIHTPATLHARLLEQLFWNRSVDEVLYFGQAYQIDAFGNRRVNPARDGRLVSRGETLHAPLLISNYAVRMRLRGAKLVARERGYDLWPATGTPPVGALTPARNAPSVQVETPVFTPAP
jgi:hypothetical protein